MAERPIINRKEQIQQTAAKLFREKGFEASTMRDIASNMNIEAASLYHHIKSKEEILENICFGMGEKFLIALREVNDIYFDAEKKLTMAILYHVQIMTSNLDEAAVFLNEWRSLPPVSLLKFKKARDQYESEFRIIIKDGKNEDIFDNVDEKFAALTVLSAVNSIYTWYNPKGRLSPNEIANRLSTFILGGLRKKLVTDIDFKP